MAQPKPQVFVFVGPLVTSMCEVQEILSMKFLELWGRGKAADAKQHWFPCEFIWNSREMPPSSKMIDFYIRVVMSQILIFSNVL